MTCKTRKTDNPRGTKNYFHDLYKKREHVSNILINLAKNYSFEGIETPCFENIDVFSKGLGLNSDIVQKEFFYIKQNNDNDILVLRPEMTAPIVRTVINESLLRSNTPLRFYYFADMFRYERPQHGRLRQFKQFGLESINGGLEEQINIILFS